MNVAQVALDYMTNVLMFVLFKSYFPMHINNDANTPLIMGKSILTPSVTTGRTL